MECELAEGHGLRVRLPIQLIARNSFQDSPSGLRFLIKFREE
jgi:hypothetical protein